SPARLSAPSSLCRGLVSRAVSLQTARRKASGSNPRERPVLVGPFSRRVCWAGWPRGRRWHPTQTFRPLLTTVTTAVRAHVPGRGRGAVEATEANPEQITRDQGSRDEGTQAGKGEHVELGCTCQSGVRDVAAKCCLGQLFYLAR